MKKLLPDEFEGRRRSRGGRGRVEDGLFDSGKCVGSESISESDEVSPYEALRASIFCPREKNMAFLSFFIP